MHRGRGGPWEQQRVRDRRSNSNNPRQRQRLNTPRLMDFDYEGPAENAGTDHLQIQELDLELALLKKKRELIEKKQALANQIQPLLVSSSQYNYGKPRERFDSGTFGQSGGLMSEYSGLYGNGSGAGQKRGAPEAWQGGAPRPRKPRLQPQSTRPNLPPPSAPKFAPKDKFFKPNKVTKPAYTPPNKRQGDSVKERPFANREATKSSDIPPEVYDAHKPMSAKVLGRLELAMGHVLKMMRLRFEDGKHAEAFKSFHSLRVLKQSIRDRIRELMQGVVVGRWDSIINLYRAKYPEDSDGELLEQISNTSSKLKAKATIESIETGNFVPHLKKSFYNIIERTLDNMFLKINEVYKKDTFGFQTVAEIYDKSFLEIAQEYNKAAEENDKDTETTSETFDNGSNISEKVNETPNSENTSAVEKTDAENENNKSSMEKKNDSVGENSEIENGNSDTSYLEDATKLEGTSKSADLSNKFTDDKFIIQKRKNDLNEDDAKARWANKFVVKLLKRNLPNELPKFKNRIIEFIKNDPEFKAMRILLGEEVKEGETPKKVKTATPFNKKIYYVMIVGRPRLPPKTEMKEFLNSFNPVSIKKHKSTSNILFVGFDDKNNFDNIIANSDVRIANMKIKIKESETTIKTSGNEDTSKENTQQQNASTVSEKSSSDVIDENLDNQINDLLNTIRNEEEKKSDVVEATNEETETKITEYDLKIDNDKTFDAANDGSAKNTEDAGDETVDAANDEGKESVAEDWVEEAKELDDEITVINDDEKVDDDVAIINDDGDDVAIISDDKPADDEQKDVVNKGLEEVQNEINRGKATPTRTSTRLAATPRTVRTRRSSKLGQD